MSWLQLNEMLGESQGETMADLLRNETSNGAGSGVELSGPCTIIVPADVNLDGGRIVVEIAVNDIPSDYVTSGKQFERPGAEVLFATGTYNLRAVVIDGGSSLDATCEVIQ